MIKKNIYNEHKELSKILDNLTNVSLELLDITKSSGCDLKKKEKETENDFIKRVNDKKENLLTNTER